MKMKPNPALNTYILSVRGKWGRVTPYRLGFAVGYAGEVIPSPYDAWGKGTRLYMDGVQAGREHRDEQQRANAAKEANDGRAT